MGRQVQVLKMRSNSPQPGLHTIRISNDGVLAFPRVLKPVEEAQGTISRELISTGIPGLDEMLGGGTLRGTPCSWQAPWARERPPRRCTSWLKVHDIASLACSSSRANEAVRSNGREYVSQTTAPLPRSLM